MRKKRSRTTSITTLRKVEKKTAKNQTSIRAQMMIRMRTPLTITSIDTESHIRRCIMTITHQNKTSMHSMHARFIQT